MQKVSILLCAGTRTCLHLGTFAHMPEAFQHVPALRSSIPIPLPPFLFPSQQLAARKGGWEASPIL